MVFSLFQLGKAAVSDRAYRTRQADRSDRRSFLFQFFKFPAISSHRASALSAQQPAAALALVELITLGL